MNQLKNSPSPETTVALAPKPEPVINRGPEIGAALLAAQRESKSNVNQAGSASGYQRLVQIYNDERRKSNFTNHISGMIVSGASLTPRIQESGEVEMQSSSTYTAKWEMSKPEHLLGQAANQARDPEKKHQALIMAVNAPLARAFQAGNPALAPTFVRQNEQTRVTKEYMAMNAVAPFGDPATGRPVFAQVWMDNGASGQLPVYGFKKARGEDGNPAYLGVIPRVDEEGQRALDLVSKVEFIPGVTNSETRHLTRQTEGHLAGSFPIETPEQQRECLEQLRQRGFEPVSKAPLHNADLPKEFRGLSEVDASARAVLKLAEAVNEHDVINKGLELFHTGDQNVVKGLGAFEKGLVQDYAAQAGIMRSAARLGDGAIKSLYAQMTATMQKLGTLRDTVEKIRKDPAAMDPITAFRVLATDIAKKEGKPIEGTFRLFDNPEDSFKRSVPASAHREYVAVDNLRKAVLEQLSKDLTDILGAWPKKPGEQWKDATTGAPLTFPDGSPRVGTPFDKALARGGKYFDTVRAEYADLVQTCINTAASYSSVRLLVGSQVQNVDRKTVALSTKDASRLAKDYVDAQMSGTTMNPQEKALVERVLQNAGPSTAYLDETMRLYTHSALVAAHRAGSSPAEVQRALLANAQDHEPWSVGVKSFPVYSYNSVPEPSGPAAYIAPEQDLPEAFNPSSLKQVRDIADARTWRVVSLMDDGGRPAPEMIKQGLSTSEMIDYRLNASQSHIPVLMARKPLPENVPLGAGLAKTYNIPIVKGSDPIDGTPGKYAVTGVRVSGSGVATTVAPGYYKAIRYGRANVVNDKEPIQFQDEAEFATSIKLSSAKDFVERHPQVADYQQTLQRMISPEREKGVHVVAMTPAGLEAFKKERAQVIDTISAVRTLLATNELMSKGKSLPPDLRGGLETQKVQLIASAEAFKKAKLVELDVLVDQLATFLERNAGKKGYVGFAPPHGLGNSAVRFRNPPLELRFADDDSIESSKAFLNKRGLNVEFDAYHIDN